MEEPINNQDLLLLIRRAQKGDGQAFDEIYARFFTPIYRYIYFRVKRKEDAEDIAQNVFMKAYQALPRFEDKGISPLAYFYSIARNAVIDHWRKKGEILFEDVGEGITDVRHGENLEHSIVERVWSQGVIREGLIHLTTLEAEAVTLKFIQDLSNKEIATLMGKSEEAVRQLQSRGLRKMKENMEKES